MVPEDMRQPNCVYLSFDDGPNERLTPKVLDLLESKGIQATFFAIATEAKKNAPLVKRIIEGGHTLGNHSYDHQFKNFFASRSRLQEWITDGEKTISDLSGEATVGFRSPAGVETPPLWDTLEDLKMPLVHWDIRFFDAVWPWTPRKAERSLARLKPGSIILLHDRQKQAHEELFLNTLDLYTTRIKEAGFEFAAIPRQLKVNY